MPSTAWAGWLQLPDEDKGEAENIGVQFGERNPKGGWNVTVPHSAIPEFDKRWGRWIWGLVAVEVD